MPEQLETVEETAQTATPKRDFRKEVTDQIIAMLERGTAPWQKPWEPGALQLPFNPTTERAYRGGNALHLMAVAVNRGFEDPRWLTYKQAQENGWQVKKGEKGSQIEFWQFGDTQSKDPREPQAAKEYDGPLRRVFTVFNASQIAGIPDYAPQKRHEWEIAEAGESILSGSGATLRHDQDDRAFYRRSSDSIHLPVKEAFKSTADYYGTALHELAHWTGHPARLNRETLNDSYTFGDQNDAKEELRAELASVFLAAERGIPHNPEQHAAYVSSWIAALRNDKNEIFRAAKDAHKATDYLLGMDRSRQLRTETSEHVANYERGSKTVNVVEKETATEHREPVAIRGDATIAEEKILDGEVDGKKPPSEREFERSLAAAKESTKKCLGGRARLHLPDTESGKYRGEIIGETDLHLIQRLGPYSAVAHAKTLLNGPLTSGTNIVVAYSQNSAEWKPNPARERRQSIER